MGQPPLTQQPEPTSLLLPPHTPIARLRAPSSLAFEEGVDPPQALLLHRAVLGLLFRFLVMYTTWRSGPSLPTGTKLPPALRLKLNKRERQVRSVNLTRWKVSQYMKMGCAAAIAMVRYILSWFLAPLTSFPSAAASDNSFRRRVRI